MSHCDAFVVEVKPSAIDRNPAVERLVAERSAWIPYRSKDVAERAATRLTVQGGSDVRIQTSAPQDSSGVDAYLVGAARPDPDLPDEDPHDGWTFSVDGDQYGALGEALLTAGDGTATPLRAYVRYDLGLDGDGSLEIDVDTGPDPVTTPDGNGAWQPDCRLEVTLDGRHVATYLCEIKTGDGSPERNQRAIMDVASKRAGVVLIHVDVSELPHEYAVRYERIGTSTEDAITKTGQRTLGEWE